VTDHPIESTPLLLAMARASIAPNRLPDLLDEAQTVLDERRGTYRRRYERALATDGFEAFFVEEGHWASFGEERGWGRRDHEAVARAHRRQLLHAGKRSGRREEFEAALELREAVVVGR
jgi:hypothetical protein